LEVDGALVAGTHPIFSQKALRVCSV